MKLVRIFASSLALLAMASANAASISMVYTGANNIDNSGAIVAQTGDVLLFDLLMDFGQEITLGGGFDVNFDPAVFAFNSYTHGDFGDPAFGRDPSVEVGRLFNGAVGDFNGLNFGVIASMSFTYLGGVGAITPSGTTGDAGPWVDGLIGLPIEPNYIAARVVPVPAAVWLLLSGLGALVGFGRRANHPA